MATIENCFLHPPSHRFLEDETRDANIIRLRASPLPEQRAVGKCMHEKQHMHAHGEAESECYLAPQWYPSHDRFEILISIAAASASAMQNLKFSTESIRSTTSDIAIHTGRGHGHGRRGSGSG